MKSQPYLTCYGLNIELSQTVTAMPLYSFIMVIYRRPCFFAILHRSLEALFPLWSEGDRKATGPELEYRHSFHFSNDFLH